MQKTTRLQRLLAVVVAVFMAVCCLPLSAFAEGKAVTLSVAYVTADGSQIGETVSTNSKLYVGTEVPYTGTESGKLYIEGLVGDEKVPEGYELVDANQKYTVPDDGLVKVLVQLIGGTDEPEEPTSTHVTFQFVTTDGNVLGSSTSTYP